MNKQQRNIKNILTFEEPEDIVYVFIEKIYETNETVALITNKELVEYTMNMALNDYLVEDFVSVKKVDLELDDIEYMISVDSDGCMVVQPVEYYDDKYFEGIEYAFVDMDGCVDQLTIDNLLDRNVPTVLFGVDDDGYECDQCECICKKDENVNTATTTPAKLQEKLTVNGKSVTKEEFDKEYEKFEEAYLDNIRDMLLRYNYFMDEMNEFRKDLFRW